MISAEEFLTDHPVHPVAVNTDEPDPAYQTDWEQVANAASVSDAGAMRLTPKRKVHVNRSDRFGHSNRSARRAKVRSHGPYGRVADDPYDRDECREAALRLLDAAPRSSGALRDKLVGKGYDADVTDEVIIRLTDVRLIDDEAYAESLVRYCAGRMMGRRGTVSELGRKGVGRRLAEQVCDDMERRGVFEEAAWQLGRSVARKTRGLDTRVRLRRLWSAGGRKGHDPEVLRRIAAELFSR